MSELVENHALSRYGTVSASLPRLRGDDTDLQAGREGRSTAHACIGTIGMTTSNAGG